MVKLDCFIKLCGCLSLLVNIVEIQLTNFIVINGAMDPGAAYVIKTLEKKN